MNIVLDTNVLVSALLVNQGVPDQLYQHWLKGSYRLLTSRQQQDELKRVLSYPKLSKRISPEQTQKLLANLDSCAVILDKLPEVNLSSDPDDNVILAMAIAGKANLLVSGDKQHLLILNEVEGIPIVTPSEALNRIESRVGNKAPENPGPN